MFFLQDDISFSVTSSSTHTFPCLVDFVVQNMQRKPSKFNHTNHSSDHFFIFNHRKSNIYKLVQYLIIRRRPKHMYQSNIIYLPSKPLVQCNLNTSSSNDLKIKREIKFNLFLKSSLIRYVILPLYFVFMNEKRFPLKISHKFYFKFTVSTEIFSQQK